MEENGAFVNILIDSLFSFTKFSSLEKVFCENFNIFTNILISVEVANIL